MKLDWTKIWKEQAKWHRKTCAEWAQQAAHIRKLVEAEIRTKTK